MTNSIRKTLFHSQCRAARVDIGEALTVRVGTLGEIVALRDPSEADKCTTYFWLLLD